MEFSQAAGNTWEARQARLDNVSISLAVGMALNHALRDHELAAQKSELNPTKDDPP